MNNKLIVGFNESTAIRKSVLLMAVLGVFSLPSQSSASVSTYTDQSAFNSQGVIAYNSNFQDFGTDFGFPGEPSDHFTRGDGTDFGFPGEPSDHFTRGDVTYTSTQNLTWGSATGYTTTATLIGNNFYSPVTGKIATAPGYNMFGFNIGTFNTSTISITVNTNLTSYAYSGLTIADSQAGKLDYKGFIATPGEYFTGFKIVADNGIGNLPGITNVTVGNVSAVPVPGAVWLFASGLLGLGALRKKAQA